MTRLITILGNPTRGASPTQQYRRASYEFPDGWTSPAHSFFGLALFEWLETQRDEAIDEVIVIGTCGSAWSTLHELVPGWDDDSISSEDWLELKERELAGEVDAPMLDLVSEKLAGHLDNTRVRCVLIPHCHDSAEQLTLLGHLTHVIPPDDRVFLDITHGFRHLGVLAMQSLMFLAPAIQVSIEGVYYGMLSPNRAVSLDGGEELVEWAEALVLLRRAGQLAPLAPLLERRYRSAAVLVEELHFFLSINAFDRAISQYNQVKGQLSAMRQGTLLDAAIGHIIECELDDIFENRSISQIQQHMARRALETGDAMRAAVLTYEAILSACIAKPNLVMDYGARELARSELRKSRLFQGKERDVFETLVKVRNCVAHGTNQHSASNSNAFVSRALKSSGNLQRFVEEAINTLDPLINRLVANPIA